MSWMNRSVSNISSPLSSSGRVKVLKRQQSNLQERRFTKEFRKKREDKKKKKKEYPLILSEDINASAEIREKNYKNKAHDKNERENKGSRDNGGVIDIKI